jgi:hypothetical protein
VAVVSVPAWWTAADAAELEVLVHELVEVAFEHREHCEACRRGNRCHVLGSAIDEVIEWRDRRALRSRAVWLRRCQDAIEKEIVW